MESWATAHKISYSGSVWCASKSIKSPHIGQSRVISNTHCTSNVETWSTSLAAVWRHYEKGDTDGGKIRLWKPLLKPYAKRSQSPKQITAFFRAGEKPVMGKETLGSILNSARDCQMFVDLKGSWSWCCSHRLAPEIDLVSGLTKQVVLLELAVLWADRLEAEMGNQVSDSD